MFDGPDRPNFFLDPVFFFFFFFEFRLGVFLIKYLLKIHPKTVEKYLHYSEKNVFLQAGSSEGGGGVGLACFAFRLSLCDSAFWTYRAWGDLMISFVSLPLHCTRTVHISAQALPFYNIDRFLRITSVH